MALQVEYIVDRCMDKQEAVWRYRSLEKDVSTGLHNMEQCLVRQVPTVKDQVQSQAVNDGSQLGCPNPLHAFVGAVPLWQK